MKKKIISICITLLLLFCSVVPTFALDTVINSQCEYWIYDLMLQTVNENTSDATWGYVLDNSSNPTMGYYAMVLDIGSAAIYEYNVKPGETVYFRWGVSNFFQASGTTTVKTVVNGTVVNTTNYTTGSGDYNSGYSVFICDDYTNTSNITQTVTYSLRNGNDLTTTYIPVKCGLEIYFDDKVGEVTGDTIVSIDLSTVENELSVIRNQILANGADLESINSAITSIKSSISGLFSPGFYNNFKSIPMELYLPYSYFFNGYNATFSGQGYKTGGPGNDYDSAIPFIRQSVRDSTYDLKRAFNTVNGAFYASFIFIYNYSPPTTIGVVYNTGNTDTLILQNTKRIGSQVVATYTFNADYAKGEYFMPLFIMSDPGSIFAQEFIPIYLGYPYIYNDLSELQSNLSSIPVIPSTKSDEVLNSGLKNSVNNLNNFEQSQVNTMTESLNNIPTLDFDAYNDFTPTIQFVSGTLQSLYDSNTFFQLIINCVLILGIALLIIGRGTRR